jgi:uncharacterized membrane protein required for colicin V production
MVWILVLLIGIPLAALGFKKGVYNMAAAAFNVLISVYIAVLASPALLRNNPLLQESGYYAAFCILFLTAACFTLLHGVCFFLFLRGADCVFPPAFEKIAGGLLGFLMGYVLSALLWLTVCMMPFSRTEVFNRFVSFNKIKTFSASTITRCCHWMAGWSLEYLGDKPEKTVEYLLSFPVPKDSTPPSVQPPSAPLPPAPAEPESSSGRLNENHL